MVCLFFPQENMIVIREWLFYSLYIGSVTSQLHYDDSQSQDALIVNGCKENYENIIINDELNKFHLTTLLQLQDSFHSITLYKAEFEDKKDILHVKKVDVILMTASSPVKMSVAVRNMQKTMWWDVMIPVYILNLKESNCDIAMEFLKTAWFDKVLKSYYLCTDKNNEIQIYTCNPFTNRAPESWKKMQEARELTIYRRKYDAETICQGLDFDRTQYLDGHEIIIAVPIIDDDPFFLGQLIDYKRIKRNESLISKRHHKILNALSTRLHVTLKIFVFNIKIEEKEEMVYEDLIKILKKTQGSLILSNIGAKFIKKGSLYIEAYPLAWETLGIATYNRGHKTIGEKVWDFYGIWTVLFTIFILLITFAVIRFSERRNTAFAVFETIRLLISHYLHTRMNTLPLRIFFITVFIYFLVLQATFNGHLAKFLTKPELRKQVETFKDLEEFGYTSNRVHFPMNISVSLAETDAEKMISTTQAKKCLSLMLFNDSSDACVLDHAGLIYYSSQNEKLYVSKKPSDDQYYAYFMRRNWYLVKCLNSFFMSLEDFGFRQFWSSDNLIHSLIHNLTVVEAKSDEDFHPIILENLMFSFWILAFGLISATVSFCVEVFMSSKSKWNVLFNMNNIKN